MSLLSENVSLVTFGAVLWLVSHPKGYVRRATHGGNFGRDIRFYPFFFTLSDMCFLKLRRNDPPPPPPQCELTNQWTSLYTQENNIILTCIRLTKTHFFVYLLTFLYITQRLLPSGFVYVFSKWYSFILA